MQKNGSCCSFPFYALVLFYLQHESQFREREREIVRARSEEVETKSVVNKERG